MPRPEALSDLAGGEKTGVGSLLPASFFIRKAFLRFALLHSCGT
jgi:hypothetical protein